MVPSAFMTWVGLPRPSSEYWLRVSGVSAALEFKEGQEAAGSAAKLGGEQMLARDV